MKIQQKYFKCDYLHKPATSIVLAKDTKKLQKLCKGFSFLRYVRKSLLFKEWRSYLPCGNLMMLPKGTFVVNQYADITSLELFGAIHWYNVPPQLGLFFFGIVTMTFRLPVLLNQNPVLSHGHFEGCWPAQIIAC